MICLDTQVLIWGVQGVARPDQIGMIGRTRAYIDYLDRKGERLMIPAPALFEYLVGFEPADQQRQRDILERRFIIPALDVPSAAVAAELMANTEFMRQIREDYDVKRQHLRIDVMIVAAAIVHRADVLVSGDPHNKKLAQ